MSSKACFPTTPYPHVFNTPPTLSNEDANWIINATLLSVLLLVVVFMGVSRMRAGRLNTTVAYNKVRSRCHEPGILPMRVLLAP